MSDIQLRRVFDFDEKDLTLNRNGRLSQKQEAKFRRAEIRAGCLFKVIGAGLLVFAAIISYAIIAGAMLEPDVDLPAALGSFNTILGLVLTWGICGLLAIGAFRISNVNINKTVKTAEGEVRFEKVRRQVRSSTEDGSSDVYEDQYDLRVGREVFGNVNNELLSMIDEGDVYAFHYLVSMKRILSAEFISKGKAS
jgi:hypothetical protein